jgi:hypothetical protein
MQKLTLSTTYQSLVGTVCSGHSQRVCKTMDEIGKGMVEKFVEDEKMILKPQGWVIKNDLSMIIKMKARKQAGYAERMTTWQNDY